MKKKEFIYYTETPSKKGALKLELTLFFSTVFSLSASTDVLVAASSSSYDEVDERSDYSV